MTLRLLRLFDLAFAAAGLVAFAIPVLVCGLIIRATSPGPALFLQTRIGRHEKPFVCIKLRTMAVGAPVAGTHEVSAAMVTHVGAVFRRLKLDEIPQLWNVFRGDMSLVGPRPCLPVQIALIEERRQLGVFSVRPGITGPGQVAGVDMSEPLRLAKIDMVWAMNPSVLDYFKLIALTLRGHGRGDRIGA